MKTNPALRLLPFLLLPACVSTGPTLAPGEIAENGVWLPKGAKEGMFIRWCVTGGAVIEKEMACVAGPGDTRTIEWRKTSPDGTSTVTAARFAEDGTTLGAWRGPFGGVGLKLRIVPCDAEATMQKAEAMGHEHGVSANANSEVGTETIETAAGDRRFANVLGGRGHPIKTHGLRSVDGSRPLTRGSTYRRRPAALAAL